MTAPLHACPKCGGTAGYIYFTMQGFEGYWGDPTLTYRKHHDHNPITVSCLNCNGRVRKRRAQGADTKRTGLHPEKSNGGSSKS